MLYSKLTDRGCLYTVNAEGMLMKYMRSCLQSCNADSTHVRRDER